MKMRPFKYKLICSCGANCPTVEVMPDYILVIDDYNNRLIIDRNTNYQTKIEENLILEKEQRETLTKAIEEWLREGIIKEEHYKNLIKIDE